MPALITTQRLLLRTWRETDLPPFAALNADPEVRRYFPSVQTRAESDASVVRFMDFYARHGYCFFAAELRETGEFIGFIGIENLPAFTPFPGEFELGWRLAREYWGRGLATEGALACRDYVFDELNGPTVCAITAATNLPSINVMRKVGMERATNFEHPKLPPQSPLRPHALYRLER